jgi:hypothetical protein
MTLLWKLIKYRALAGVARRIVRQARSRRTA